MENEVLKQLALSGARQAGPHERHVMPGGFGYQDMGGRVTRYPLRSTEKTDGSRQRDAQLGDPLDGRDGRGLFHLFPTGMLNVGLHPQGDGVRTVLGLRPLGSPSKALPDTNGRMYTMIAAVQRPAGLTAHESKTFGDLGASAASW